MTYEEYLSITAIIYDIQYDGKKLKCQVFIHSIIDDCDDYDSYALEDDQYDIWATVSVILAKGTEQHNKPSGGNDKHDVCMPCNEF